MAVFIEDGVIHHGKGNFALPEKGKAILIEDMTMEDYHALGNVAIFGNKAIFSKSQLVEMACPRRFQHYYINGGERKETDALRVGSAAHVLALEPELFNKQFYVLPEGIIRNPKHAAYKEQLDIAGERMVLTQAQHKEVLDVSKAVARDRIADVVLNTAGKIEATIIWHDEATGLYLKTRPDFLRDDGIAVDLKTCLTAEPEAFARAAYDKGYDISVAMTFEGYKALTGNDLKDYIFLAVEKSAPNIIEAYNSFAPFDKGDPSQMTYYAVGDWRYKALLDKLVDSLSKNKWQTYRGKITPMSVPSWELKKLEN
jgi:exodeoxyribonuclease VIII